MEFKKGAIEGVVVTSIRKFSDERGWLAEFFRNDEVATEFQPAMGYLSVTLPGILRGPHEHVDQADLFAWVGPGEFKVTLWDNRSSSPTYLNRMELFMGACNPGSIIVPKGVVHCYRCVSAEPGWVLNCPNRLYAGQGKREPVDEIRHEDDPENPFVFDERLRRASLK
jgi:dTDP-4-dehydrorhamnose 3,5-epimerase